MCRFNRRVDAPTKCREHCERIVSASRVHREYVAARVRDAARARHGRGGLALVGVAAIGQREERDWSVAARAERASPRSTPRSGELVRRTEFPAPRSRQPLLPKLLPTA